LDQDDDLLYQLFTDDEVVYYVGRSPDLLRIQEKLGEEQVGVTSLPTGYADSAGPFLETEPIYISTASSNAQTQRALLLIHFLTNVEQQRKLAQSTGRVPANAQVRIDRRVSPAVAGFVEQSKTAVPLRLIPQVADAVQFGEEAYIQVLEGLSDSTNAANQLTARVNQIYGFDTIEIVRDEPCEMAGDLAVWHSWGDEHAVALDKVSASYMQRCPDTTITLTSFSEDELIQNYEEVVRNGEGPELLLTSNSIAIQLASNELLHDIGNLVDPGFLQRYIPTAPDALRYEGRLFGIPISVNTSALYYNKELVDAPPVDLNDLVERINTERQIALPYTPYQNIHWGLSAFGGRLYDAEEQLAFTHGEYAEWLDWLQKANVQPGVVLTREAAEAQELFATGDAAFLVADATVLRQMQDKLGKEAVEIASLPSGPEGAAGPILQLNALR
ncbi:extracellular solute-binding protein, partial [Chloroflexi bacterium TSY]|nr:extracellular solute-binding protein [Chloroflexi bacterium TSY]